MKKVFLVAISLVVLSLASENVIITKEMADALGKNEITKLYLETGNTLVKAKVSEDQRGFSICDLKNKNDCIRCSTIGIRIPPSSNTDFCHTFVNGVKVSEKEFDVEYIRKFYMDIVKMHRKVK